PRHMTAIELQHDFIAGDAAEVIGIGFPLLNQAEFPLRKIQFAQQAFPSMPINIDYRERFACCFAQLTCGQQRREMIARRDIPFASANENPRLLGSTHRKIPSLIVDRVRSWDKLHGSWITFGTNVAVNFRSLWSRGDASIGFADDFHETR